MTFSRRKLHLINNLISGSTGRQRNEPQESDTFENIFKTPQCLAFSEDDLSSHLQESEGEKVVSLELVKEVGVDPKARKYKDQYQRFAIKDGDVKTFVNKSFRHRLVKEHYQALAKAAPMPNMQCMDWAKLEPTSG